MWHLVVTNIIDDRETFTRKDASIKINGETVQQERKVQDMITGMWTMMKSRNTPK